MIFSNCETKYERNSKKIEEPHPDLENCGKNKFFAKILHFDREVCNFGSETSILIERVHFFKLRKKYEKNMVPTGTYFFTFFYFCAVVPGTIFFDDFLNFQGCRGLHRMHLLSLSITGRRAATATHDHRRPDQVPSPQTHARGSLRSDKSTTSAA